MDETTNASETNAVSQPALAVNVETPKKKKKYSRGLKDYQKMERRYARASSKVTRAVSRGIKTYLKASDKSARKKRDGALLDWGKNAAKGLGKGLQEVSTVPLDLTKAVSTKRTRKIAKRQVRMAARIARRMRFR